MKAQMNSILEDTNLTDERENNDNKNAKIVYISEEKLNFINNNDIDDENRNEKESDNKLKIERKT
jgi:hypothetical protein